MTSDTFEMTPTERATANPNLRVAATHCDDDAARATMAGMAETWRRQAAEARRGYFIVKTVSRTRAPAKSSALRLQDHKLQDLQEHRFFQTQKHHSSRRQCQR